jgi:hypothetical protein
VADRAKRMRTTADDIVRYATVPMVQNLIHHSARLALGVADTAGQGGGDGDGTPGMDDAVDWIIVSSSKQRLEFFSEDENGGDVSRPLNLPSLTPHTPFSSSPPSPLPRSLTFRQIISSALRTVDHRPHTRVRRVRVRRPVR